MRSIIVLVTLLAATPSARGLIIEFVQVDNTVMGQDPLYPGFNDADWRTFDLIVTISPYAGDWTAASVEAHVDGVFFQHAAGGRVEPTAALLASFPLLEFDTFFADPPALFDGEQPLFADGPHWADSTVEATWYDKGMDEGGPYTLARFTLTGGIRLQGNRSHCDGDGLCSYEFTTFPAPGTRAVLLGGLRCRPPALTRNGVRVSVGWFKRANRAPCGAPLWRLPAASIRFADPSPRTQAGAVDGGPWRPRWCPRPGNAEARGDHRI